jgi:hypothetical protein
MDIRASGHDIFDGIILKGLRKPMKHHQEITVTWNLSGYLPDEAW